MENGNQTDQFMAKKTELNSLQGEPGVAGYPGRDGMDGLPGLQGAPGLPGEHGCPGLNVRNPDVQRPRTLVLEYFILTVG